MHRTVLSACVVLLLSSSLSADVLEVEGPQDSLAGAPSVNHCTLRKAIINANNDAATYPQCRAGNGIDTIVFISPMTVTFALAGISEEGGLTGDLDITESVIIDGGGSVIDGAGLDRIFDINPGGAAGVEVTIANVHLRNGSGLGGGGGIQSNNATLHLQNVTISGSHAPHGDGGAIVMANGGVLNMTNSTISGNDAAFHAGAMVLEGTANITGSTITANASLTGLTGGLRALGIVNVRSSIVAGNTNISPLNYIPNLDGTFTSAGYNVIGDLGAAPGNPVIVAAAGDQFGVTAAAVNLGPLQINGGGPPTHALLSGSVAIDKGHSSGSASDERGLTRPCDLAAVANAAGGDGADAGAFVVQGSCVGTNTDPQANDDPATVAEDSGPNSIAVLANDTDAEGDTLVVSAVTQGAHGAVANDGSSVSYTPAANFAGMDSFHYTTSDGNGGEDTATVSVTVTAVQDAPDAVDDTATVAEDGGPYAIAVLANDGDVDGDTLSVTGAGSAAHGTVTSSASGVTYAPHADFFGSDSFTYTIGDGHGGSDTATVLVTVTNVNDAPGATADNYVVNQDTPLTIGAPGVLGNDTDADADALTATLVANVVHGSLVLSSGGGFTYHPHPAFAGTDSFTYRAQDAATQSNTAQVTIQVLDTQPPDVSASLTTAILWSPNHELVDVGFALTVTDNGGGSVATSAQVFSDEDDVTPGGGDQSPDAKAIAPGTLRLRSERSGGGNGRVYLVRVLATDAASNTRTACVTAVVPKSSSAADLQSVALQADAARAQCLAGMAPPPGYFVVGDGPIVGPKQ